MPHAPPRMASLTSLLEEPIIHVVTNCGLKSRRLYNLGLVNNYFSTLSLPLIYRDVKLLWVDDSQSRSFLRFQEIIEKFPERALVGRSLEVTCDRYDDGRMGIFSGHNSPVNLLLGRSHSWKSLLWPMANPLSLWCFLYFLQRYHTLFIFIYSNLCTYIPIDLIPSIPARLPTALYFDSSRWIDEE